MPARLPYNICYNIITMRVNENILISSLTTMRLGGPSRYVIEVERPEEIPEAYGFAATYHLPTFVLGYGANTIGHDEGFPGVIIISRMHGIFESPVADGVQLKIMSGEYWDDAVAYACSRGLTGIEALSLIPGLAGAAPVQNIGAYGQEVADTLESVDVYDTTSHTFRTLSRTDLQFGYRKSILNTTESGRYFVISITLHLHTGQMSHPLYRSLEKYLTEHGITDTSPASIRNAVIAIRQSKLPDPLKEASAGSFFKNIFMDEATAEACEAKGYPVHRIQNGGKLNSGWLIEHAGLSGKLIHGIRVSDKASLVLINESATGYADLAAARDAIISKVYDTYGFWLEQEPVEIYAPDTAPYVSSVEASQ